jgi:phage terminase large subunit GpA-like protein
MIIADGIFNERIAPEQQFSILDWIEANVELPHSARNPKFRRDTAPWLSKPLEEIARDTNHEVVICAPVGSGKTTLFECMLAWVVAQAPGPTLFAGQTDELSKEWAETRLAPVFNSTAPVARLFPKDRHAKRKTEIIFPHMPLFVGGANISNLQEKSIRWCIGDEVWRWKHGMVEEFRRRTHDRWNSRVVLVSQGGEEGDDFHAAYDLCDQWQFQWICPHCQRRQPWRFEMIRFDRERKPDGSLDWDRLTKSTHMVCAGCEARFEDRAEVRRQLSSGSEYVQVGEGMPGRVAFTYPAIAVWWIPWGKLAAEWVKAEEAWQRGDREPRKQFLQKRMAQRWEDRTAHVSNDAVVAMRDPSYKRGQMPINPALVTLCADPGQMQTHWSVQAWTAEGEAYVIDYGTTFAIEDLIPLASRMEWKAEGRDEPVRVMCGLVDSGDFTERVYATCARSVGVFFPSKGSAAQAGTWDASHLSDYPTLVLYRYVDFSAKVALYIERIAKKSPPLLHFPVDAGEDFLLGHMGQKIIESEKTKGRVWKKVAGDHYGDCTKLHLVTWWVMRTHLQQEPAQPLTEPAEA